MKKLTKAIPLIAAFLFGITQFPFYDVFVNNWDETRYAVVLVAVAVEMIVAVCFFPKKMSKKRKVLTNIIGTVCWLAGGLLIPTYVLNNNLRIGERNVCGILLTLNFIVFLVLGIISLSKTKAKKFVSAICIVLCLTTGVIPFVVHFAIPLYYEKYSRTEVLPVNLSRYTEKEYSLVKDADYYVSLNGNDENDGTFEHPFATIEKARDVIAELDKTDKKGITVAVTAGEYRTDGITFSEENSGTKSCPITYCAYGDGEVVINGGAQINPSEFKPVTDEKMLSRLSDDAKQKVVCADLAKLGITKDDYGKIYAIGTYNTAAQYDGDYVGEIYSEVFVNDKRLTLAKYPNDGWLTTDTIIEQGLGLETDDSHYQTPGWKEMRNPKSETYGLDKELTERVASWETLDDVWMYGFWKYTWADGSTPIEKFDPETGYITTKFVSLYGVSKTAPYYFFNVFEELDAPGEFYLDRQSGMLYIYPSEELNNSTIDISLSSNSVFNVENADYLTFRGFTVKGTKGNGFTVKGNHITITLNLVKNIGGDAITVEGYDNLISENEITRTGNGCIYVTGGDTETLTPGNNKVDNNLIHDWAEVNKVYRYAVSLKGVGNICSHNEIFNSPSEPLVYSGNNNIIEYNYIHDVNQLSDDAGAIHPGRSWIQYGNIIRYNVIANTYTEEHRSSGIYFDDALSGQEVYGNFLINIGHHGFLLGGGRDLIVKNNIIVNTLGAGISYDDRARDGCLNQGWFHHADKDTGDMWDALYNSPWQSQIWQEAYPQYKNYSDDWENTDSPDFVPNPSYSDISNNLVINVKGTLGNISDAAEKYSTIKDNAAFGMNKLDEIFIDAANGDFRLNKDSSLLAQYPQIEDVPFEEIGRY